MVRVISKLDVDNGVGTVFAYGQTGTGKTFTMSGIPTDPTLRGVIPNSFQHIFDRITTTTNDTVVGVL
jgi:hypothetical protein